MSIHPVLDPTRNIHPADLVPLTDAARTVPLDIRTLRKHLNLDGVPLVYYRTCWLVSWVDFNTWVAANTDRIAQRAAWGRAIHAGRKSAQASSGEVANARA